MSRQATVLKQSMIALVLWGGTLAGSGPVPGLSPGRVVASETAEEPNTLCRGDVGQLPVQEVTVFKDGHAFVLRTGTMPTNADGDVVLDRLPRPVIGTFWPFSADERARLSATVAGRQVVAVAQTALSMRELLEANLGRRVQMTEAGPLPPYEAMLMRLLERSRDELRRTRAGNDEPALAQKSDLLWVQTAGGVRVVQIDQIQKLLFLETPRDQVTVEERRDVMTLKLAWSGRPADHARVGMVYLERGLRWIPSYRITLDGQGRAHVELQGTLVNELADLEDVTAHLVVGVPRFAFEDTVDPISLQRTVAQLAPAFGADARTAYAFSNAIMTQAAAVPRRAAFDETNGSDRPVDLGPSVAGTGRNEDLYVFTVEHITLERGCRMVVPVAEFDLAYRDVYVLNVPPAPPAEVWRNVDSRQPAPAMDEPKFQHVIRLTNDSTHPITTAPALVLCRGQLIAQAMTRYTAVGATGDVELTAAVDIGLERSDEVTERVPAAGLWEGRSYARSDLRGRITIRNHKSQTLVLEVTRSVLGHIDEASDGGRVEHVSRQDDGWREVPEWWNGSRWPDWWYHLNALGRVTWDVELAAGQEVELTYRWHYFWRR